jgi:superfamily II DNA or RNA helicase
LYDHVDHRASVVIASVQTLVGLPDSDPLWAECRLLVLDEVHHQIKGGAHGKVREKMVNARALGLSATPIRADGKGLGRHADGYMDVLLEGPNARSIELMGFLAPHVIYAPPSDLDLSTVPVAASGDYSPKPLAEATRKSHILGDVVDHYRRLADGLLGMTFCVDVESCVAVAVAFRAAGVPAEVVTGKTPPDARNAIFRKFRNRQILQLVSCEIAGEGFDLPDVEVISLARASESYTLATQQIGRVKRALPGKTKGIVIDHVGNTTRHCQAKRCAQTGEWYIAVGEREWTLDRRERRSASNKPTVAITTCPMCLRSYERVIGRKCPYCSHETQPSGRSAPEQVDGVLSELDPAALAAIQHGIAHVDGAPTIPWGATPAIQGAVVKRHRERQEAQVALRQAMAAWAGSLTQEQDADSVARLQREFYLTFGVDVGMAQTLGRTEAEALRERVDNTVNLPHNAPHHTTEEFTK